MPYVKKKDYEELLKQKDVLKEQVQRILARYPRSDNVAVKGKLVGTDCLVQQLIAEL